MTTTNDLVTAALAAADLFRDGDLRPLEIRALVRAADAYRLDAATEGGTHQASHGDWCLMCAVRALTEGNPAATWNPTTKGQTIGGVVLRMGEVDTNLGKIPFVDLWQGGTGRVRVMAYAQMLRLALDGAAAQIGDRLQVWFDGQKTINRPGSLLHGKNYKTFSVNVERGH